MLVLGQILLAFVVIAALLIALLCVLLPASHS
jgi:hypothetical protein